MITGQPSINYGSQYPPSRPPTYDYPPSMQYIPQFQGSRAATHPYRSQELGQGLSQGSGELLAPYAATSMLAGGQISFSTGGSGYASLYGSGQNMVQSTINPNAGYSMLPQLPQNALQTQWSAGSTGASYKTNYMSISARPNIGPGGPNQPPLGPSPTNESEWMAEITEPGNMALQQQYGTPSSSSEATALSASLEPLRIRGKNQQKTSPRGERFRLSDPGARFSRLFTNDQICSLINITEECRLRNPQKFWDDVVEAWNRRYPDCKADANVLES